MSITTLKQDLFGRVELIADEDALQLWKQLQLPGNAPAKLIARDTRVASPRFRLLARRLARREAILLRRLPVSPQLPQLLSWRDGLLLRSWIAGRPMQEAEPRDRAYFAEAHQLLSKLHRAGVVHNDTAKEPNWLVTDEGRPALVDYQLAWSPAKRGWLFRTLGREDLRHLLKHKRNYIPEQLTRREQRILAKPAVTSRLWMNTAKPVYNVVTRRILGWSDREGAGDRSL